MSRTLQNEHFPLCSARCSRADIPGPAVPPKGRWSLCPQLLAGQEGAQRGLQCWHQGDLAEYATAEELPTPSWCPRRVSEGRPWGSAMEGVQLSFPHSTGAQAAPQSCPHQSFVPANSTGHCDPNKLQADLSGKLPAINPGAALAPRPGSPTCSAPGEQVIMSCRRKVTHYRDGFGVGNKWTETWDCCPHCTLASVLSYQYPHWARFAVGSAGSAPGWAPQDALPSLPAGTARLPAPQALLRLLFPLLLRLSPLHGEGLGPSSPCQAAARAEPCPERGTAQPPRPCSLAPQELLQLGAGCGDVWGLLPSPQGGGGGGRAGRADLEAA